MNNKLNSEISAETNADKSGAADNTTSSHSSANTTVACCPVRVQRKTTKGWKMPENTIYVGRPSKWGNPYIVGKTIKDCDYWANPEFDENDFLSCRGANFRKPYVDSYMKRVGYTNETIITHKIAVELYEHYLSNLLVADDTGYYVGGEYYEPESLGTLNKELEKLKGKNLACFCPLDKPCHADVLLELVNG